MIAPELLSYESFFFDLDGVIWEAEKAFTSAVDFITRLSQLNKNIYFVSNNATQSRQNIQRILVSQGIPAKLENIYCACYACSLWLKDNYPANTKIFSIAQKAINDELKEAGYQVIEGSSLKDLEFIKNSDFLDLEIDLEVKVVVVGFTPELNYPMLCYGSMCIQNGARLVTANYDLYDKFGKYNVPSCGCVVEALKSASGTTDFVNLGKPNPFLLELTCKRDGLDPQKIIFFGDKMRTDIKLAHNFNCTSVLMLTGVESQESYSKYEYQPDFVYNSFEDALI